MLFSSWDTIIRIVVTGLCAYIGIVFILRISGNRTLSKMNSFDFIITIALGSALGSGLLQKSAAVSDILAIFAVLVGLQYLVTWASVRSKFVNSIVTTEPTLVFINGRFLTSAMQDVRVTRDEVLSAIRKQGFENLEQIEAVVLESDGTLSAIGAVHTATRNESARMNNNELIPAPE